MNELTLVQWFRTTPMCCATKACRTRPISRRSLVPQDGRRARAAGGRGSDQRQGVHDCRWPLLRDLQGEKLTRRYSAILDKLPRLSGIVGTIFLKAQNEIQDPAKLRRLVGLIDGETWLGLGVDVKGSRTAASGPRPRCSTGGFLWRPGSTCARSRWRAIPKSTRRRGHGFLASTSSLKSCGCAGSGSRPSRRPSICGSMICARTIASRLKERPMTRADLDDFVAC